MVEKSILIQCRVDNQEKDEWKEFARIKLFPSVSELIRYSVSKIIEENSKRDTKWFIKNANKMPKNNYIRVRLREEEKHKWDQYIEKRNFPSVSELIRFSVCKIVDEEMKRYLTQNNRMYLLYRNNYFYQNELNKFLERPPCKNCGLSGLTWSQDGLCLDCYSKKKDINSLEVSKGNGKNFSKFKAVKIPRSLIEEINKNLELDNVLGYQSYSEFILDAIRHRLEDVKKIK